MTAEIIKLRNSLKTLTESNFTGVDNVTVHTAIKVRTEIRKILGTKIWFFPVNYADGGPVTRRENQYDLQIGVVYAEKYGQPGVYPDSWVEDRIFFVESRVFDPLSSNQTLYGEDENYRSQEAETTILYDLDLLDEFNLFWSELLFTYRTEKG